ncbi:MAG: hypothetical protein COV72_09290 [Candidatus Omnitrophica bacterium CG11_big_fil_rev_8_21_14_0_20_42_13]|uniref:Glycosyltransferase RgtA/B/C/D-like domain-containing protein n=1 Tax=Candidatus Ghiorseimicrobium undicola TaxID=1974746 RepID=A0A2H0LV51_9BACT|nr:MAG: hypothetical protein COV72_09290 [Candidatus Omnitrophica bacterium CG11_big_fil_rev_8_21_14_0_20_42_13]
MKLFAKKEALYISLILVFTFLIRLGYLFLLRTKFYVVAEDEVIYIENSLRVIFNNMQPGLFFHGALYFYFVSCLHHFFFIMGKIFGLFNSNIDYLVFFLEKPEVFYFMTRMVSVFTATATVYFIYRLGDSLWDKKTGLLAAFFVSLTPMALIQGSEASAYATTNLFIVIAAFLGVEFMKKTRPRSIFSVSVVFGLALSSDYYALFMIPFFVLIICAADRLNEGPSKLFADIFIFSAISLLVFIVINPYFALRPALAWQSIIAQTHTAVFPQYNQSYTPLRYVWLLLKPPYLFISLFFFVGIWFSARSRKIGEIAIFLFPLINIALFSFSKIQLERYIFHSLPFLSLIAANAIIVLTRIKKLDFAKMGLIIFLFVIFCMFNYKSKSYSSDTWIAKNWIEKNIPKKSDILIEPGTIPFGRTRLLSILFNHQDKSNERLYFSVLKRYLQAHPEEDYELWPCNLVKDTIPVISHKNVRYIILSEKDYDWEGVDWLQENAVLIKAFAKYGDTWRIRIYKVLNPLSERECTSTGWW